MFVKRCRHFCHPSRTHVRVSVAVFTFVVSGFLVGNLVYAEQAAESKTIKKDRILFLGNSITRHGPAKDIGWTGNWGMAASAEEKDYVHLVAQALSKPALPGEKISKPEVMAENIAAFERQYATYPMEERLKKFLDFKPSLVVVGIGENVAALTTEESKALFLNRVSNLLKRLKANGNPTIVVRSCFWPNAVKDQVLKKATAEVSGIFVDISKLGKDEANYARSEREFKHAGVAAHPGDKGMKAIADAIVDAIKKAASRAEQ